MSWGINQGLAISGIQLEMSALYKEITRTHHLIQLQTLEKSQTSDIYSNSDSRAKFFKNMESTHELSFGYIF